MSASFLSWTGYVVVTFVVKPELLRVRTGRALTMHLLLKKQSLSRHCLEFETRDQKSAASFSLAHTGHLDALPSRRGLELGRGRADGPGTVKQNAF